MDGAAENGRGWIGAARVYGDPRVLAFLFFGFASGLPFGVLAEPLSAWLFEAGLDKTAIGLFALVSLPYSLKFVWAPLMDRLPLPLLTRAFGRRRGWALSCQGLLMAAIVGIGLSRPEIDPWTTAGLALLVAFASASQDIVVDAYRVEVLKRRQLAAGAATTVFGWRVGQAGGAAAALVLAESLPWPVVFAVLAGAVAVGMIAVLLNPEPEVTETAAADQLEAETDRALELRAHLPHRPAAVLAWVLVAVWGPLREFASRPGWAAVVAFVLLYKFGDAILGVMKVPFFLELGFTKTEIAEVAKLFGISAIIVGGFLGGWLLARVGIMRGLLACGVLMALSNLVFVAQNMAGASVPMLMVTIGVENVTTGLGTTAFVAYLSSLCNRAYTATQYALLTSLMAFSRTAMSSGAGWLADRVDWNTFFILTTVAALPGLLLLVWMMRRWPTEPR